jgi:radical SAM superfamily enzyme YgiQ (UPF0313 family)
MKIKEADFDVVGTGSLITTYTYLKWLAKVLKKHHPTKPLIMGGKVVSSMQEQIMGFIPQVDIVVYGEGEITVVELVDCFDRGGRVFVLTLYTGAGQIFSRNVGIKKDKNCIRRYDEI